MKNKAVSLLVFICALSFSANAALADLSASLKLYEGYSYWSSRYYQENVSPALCSTDSITALKNYIQKENLDLDFIDFGISQQCEQWVFMGGMLPKMARDMDVKSRKFFKSYYGLAFYLSGLNPIVKGPYHKKGWWQLTYPVAIKYGLRVDQYVDERLDPYKSSEAAERYFADLESKYKSTDLAIIAFVYGPIEVEKILSKDSKSVLLDLRHRNTIREVKTYFKMFNWILARMPFSVAIEKVENLQNVRFKGKVVIDLLLAETHIEKEDFYRYNPMLIGNVIPINYHEVILPNSKYKVLNTDSLQVASVMWIDSLDLELAKKREALRSNIPDPKKYNYTSYTVRSGESLGLIADRYHVKIKDLKDWNNLRSDVIYIGQKLKLYIKESSPTKSSESVAQKPKETSSKPIIKKESVIADEDVLIYTIKFGDTLWSIAQNYPGISADNIMDWNGIDANLQVGQKLKIKKSEIRNK